MSITVLADEHIVQLAQCLDDSVTLRTFSGRSLDAAQLKGVDGLLVRSITQVNAALLEETQVRFVGSATSGLDHIDLDFLTRAGVSFAHAPGANANSVVEYVLAVLCAQKNVLERLLEGGRVGIVGHGYVGQLLQQRLRHLGIKTQVSDPWVDQTNIAGAVSFEEILTCDVIAVHCELTKEAPWPSLHLFAKEALGRLKAPQLLINASRGAVVDNSALRERLDLPNPPTVALDVWEGEPQIDQALAKKVTWATPHIAGYSYDGKLTATRILCEAMYNALGIVSANAFEVSLGASQGPLQGASQGPSLETSLEDTAKQPPISLEGAALCQLDSADLVRYLIGQRYSVAKDDAEFRDTVAAATPAIAQRQFDRLRREYPVRRELAGSTVLVAQPTDAQRKIMSALGCAIERTDG